ncbi:hypothetical protein CHUAL_010628 [Chamberlinius hualienensis]
MAMNQNRCSKTKLIFHSVLVIATVAHLIYLGLQYISCEDVNSYQVEQQTNLLFPSITVCSNIPIRQSVKKEVDMSSYLDYYDNMILEMDGYEDMDGHLEIDKTLQNDKDILKVKLTMKNEMNVINKIAKHNETMRLQYAEYPVDNIQLKLHMEQQEKTDYDDWSYNIFNNLYYGNCITMNSLQYHLKYRPIESNRINGLTYSNKITTFRNGKSKQKDAISKYQVMVIHEPYTQPVFDMSNIIRLPVSVETYVAVTKIDIKHEQKCISRDDYMPLNNSFKQMSQEQHYLYTMEACIANCLQNLTMKYCNCQIPWFHSYSNLPVCKGCRSIPQEELNRQCDCKPPCKYSKYNLKVQQEVPLTEAESLSETEFRVALHKEAAELYFKQLPALDLVTKSKYNKNFYTKAIIEMENFAVDTFQYSPSCKIEIVLSQVGGILGVYLGLSITILIEMAYDFVLIKIHSSSSISDFSASANNSLLPSSISLIVRIYNSKLLLKWIWLFVLLGGVCKSAMQAQQLFQIYLQYPVSHTQSTIEKTFFPSVTVCSNNMMTKGDNSPLKTLMMNKYKKFIESGSGV